MAVALALCAPALARAGVAHAPRAPVAPPLTSATPGAGGGEPGAAPAVAPDPLAGNGLNSPGCAGTALAQLTAAGRSHCATSGFVAAGAPTGDFGIDVHIDTGFLGFSEGTLLSAIQDMLLAPVWMALVWLVRALVVLLEWCFAVDPLTSASSGGIAAGLRGTEAAFTEAWLPLAFAVASVLAAYHGLVRRRVAQTAGDAALMAAMMSAGLWVILDPAGTIGALGQWADQASMGALATAMQGSPSRPERALSASLQSAFAAAIEAPWCYLEFGDVEWCRRPARLDPRLRSAGLTLAAQEDRLVGCTFSPTPLLPCAPAHSAAADAMGRSARLLREARSNGAIFLALPANGPARNSIDDEGSLLAAICGGPSATACRGPSAGPAEFRTNGGTWPRLAGLVLIATGVAGMLLLLGFLAVRLLTAAIFSLLYLLLAPAVVLAPAFGEPGRALFRRWLVQLMGTVVAKLVYSFVLGALLAVFAVLASLPAIGWWTQWLLTSTFWWAAFTRRHTALARGGGALRGGAALRVHRARPRPVRLLRDVLSIRASVAETREQRRLSARQASTRQQQAARAQRPWSRGPTAATRAPSADNAPEEPVAPEPRRPPDFRRPPEPERPLLADVPAPKEAESAVMRDLFAVQEGRKKHIGFGNP
jgi:hypothetical protein